MRQPRPTIRQLEYFVAVAECESFRGAAEKLDVSQPTITAQVAGLEKLLNVPLFERSRSGARLSPAGRQLLGGARRVLEELGGLVESADSIANRPGGTYRLGVTPTLGPYVLPHLLPELHRRYPELRLHVREQSPRDLETGLADGVFDLIMSTLPLDTADFYTAALFREPVKLVVAADHPLASRERITVDDLRNADILTIDEHHRFFGQVEQICRRLGARVLREYQGTSLDALRHMTVMGLGHAFLPALYVISEIHDQSQLRVTEIEGEPMFRLHALAWRPASPARGFFQRLAADMRGILSGSLGGTIQPVE
ncbi:MAG: hydrogen peroxide-inducible genes activator [Gammaproteobacteria bacterium]